MDRREPEKSDASEPVASRDRLSRECRRVIQDLVASQGDPAAVRAFVVRAVDRELAKCPPEHRAELAAFYFRMLPPWLTTPPSDEA